MLKFGNDRQLEINWNTPRPIPTAQAVTSIESAQAMERSGAKGHHRKRVYDFIATRKERGATCDEVEVGLDLRHQTASCFIRFLTQDGFLRDSGMKRRTRAGRQAIVWVTA